jgi:hypothetical protein
MAKIFVVNEQFGAMAVLCPPFGATFAYPEIIERDGGFSAQ